jgi:type IV pilus assembly protein PilW
MSRTAMHSYQPSRRRSVMRSVSSNRGMSLVELMVAMAIGLVLSLTVLVSTLTIGRQLQGTGAVAAADVNAQVALSLIDEAARSAGAGLYNRQFPICPRWNAFRNGAVVANGAALMPARIVDGGANPDRIEFTGLTEPNAGTATPLVTTSTSADAGFTVGDANRLAVGDIALVGVPPATAAGLATVPPCTLFVVTGVTPNVLACDGNATQCTEIQRAANVAWNPAVPSVSFTTAARYAFNTAGGGVGPAVVQRVGNTFRQEGFTVLPACNTLVNYDAFDGLPTCTSPTNFSAGANALAGDVVTLQAQYGLAAPNTYKVASVAPAAPQSNVVTQWVDATGAWANPTPGDVVRIQAIRVVVVTRSREPEVGTEVAPATCTNPAGVVNTGPCSFDDAEAPVIDVSAAPVPAGRTWRNYRYRVHQSVIPLRNVIWNSAP